MIYIITLPQILSFMSKILNLDRRGLKNLCIAYGSPKGASLTCIRYIRIKSMSKVLLIHLDNLTIYIFFIGIRLKKS